MADEELPIPVEIPWRLAATTQELKSGDADEATISLFSFEPDLPTFTSDYPDERIYYFKFVVSVSPIAEPNGGFSDVALSYLENGLPIMLLLLDLKVTPLPSTLGGIRLSGARPDRRRSVRQSRRSPSRSNDGHRRARKRSGLEGIVMPRDSA